MPSPKKPHPAPKPAPARSVLPAPKPQPPPPPPPRQFLVRCTFVGEQQKKKLDGSFRFICEAADADAVRAKLEPAVKRLRRSGEIPSQCDVYVEFILELGELQRGLVADFERWERDPKRFQHGCVAFSETCAVYHHEQTEPAFRFGKSAEPPAAAPVPEAE